jgi:hypothetical protein
VLDLRACPRVPSQAVQAKFQTSNDRNGGELRFLPDFIGIGAQKAGTTWLFEQLDRHPEVWMAPIKEMHYFDRSLKYASPSRMATDAPLARLFGRGAHNREFRTKLFNQVGKNLRRPSWKRLRWDARYFFGTCSDEWYASLFRDGAGKVTGEITPSYAILDRVEVAHIRDLKPDLKILFLIRNPIERAWSFVRFNRVHGESIDFLKAYLDEPRMTIRNDYLATLDAWGEFFPPEQFFTGFYDDVVARPGELLRSIFDFLGISGMELPSERIEAVVNPSVRAEIPPEVKSHLQEMCRPEIEQLSERLGGRAAVWLRELNAGD